MSYPRRTSRSSSDRGQSHSSSRHRRRSRSSSRRRRKRPSLVRRTAPIVGVSLVSLVVLFGLYNLIFSESIEDLLNADTLNSSQIRRLATNYLLHKKIDLRERASRKLATQGEAAVPVLQEVAMSNPEVRKPVLNILMVLNVDAAFDQLEVMIEDEDAAIRVAAASAAVSNPHPRSGEILSKVLDDDDTGVRLMVIEGARFIGRPAIEPLMHSLGDPNTTVRRHAARALRGLTGKDFSQYVNPGQ